MICVLYIDVFFLDYVVRCAFVKANLLESLICSVRSQFPEQDLDPEQAKENSAVLVELYWPLFLFLFSPSLRRFIVPLIGRGGSFGHLFALVLGVRDCLTASRHRLQIHAIPNMFPSNMGCRLRQALALD